MSITGYRTNSDHTETLAWTVQSDGTVVCDHDSARCCQACLDADARLGVTADGSAVVIVHWPSHATRDGRTVRYSDWTLDTESRPGWPRWVTAQHLAADADHSVVTTLDGVGDPGPNCEYTSPDGTFCGLAIVDDGVRHGRNHTDGDTAADQDYNGGRS